MATVTSSFFLEGQRMLKRHLKVRGKHYRRYAGDAMTICNTIISSLWNGTYLQTSLGHYNQFYARDFGMSLPSLLTLEMREEAKKTLRYALAHYRKAGKVTTHLTPTGKAISFPNAYSPDSLAYLLLSIRLINDQQTIDEYKGFLQMEIKRFCQETLSNDGTVKRHKHLGGMRDHCIRDASCYDTTMAAVVQREAKKLKIAYPYEDIDYAAILKRHYWKGTHFADDMTNDEATADANIYPFWHGIITDKKMLKAAIRTMRKLKMDQPFPIKYTPTDGKKQRMLWVERFVPDWEQDAVWPMSALPYIDVVARVDKQLAREYLEQYTGLIERYGTFIEVYDRHGKPYTSTYYSADEGMIWAAQYLRLKAEIYK